MTNRSTKLLVTQEFRSILEQRSFQNIGVKENYILQIASNNLWLAKCHKPLINNSSQEALENNGKFSVLILDSKEAGPLSPVAWAHRFGVAFSYVSKTRWKQILLQYKDKWRKTFTSYFAKGRFSTWYQKNVSGSKPPNPQFPLTPFPCFHTYSPSTTFSPSNAKLVKVAQCKFYMTCALTFKRYSPPPPET